MGWIKPALNFIMGGLHEKDMNWSAECPWKADCPQHVYEDKIGRKLQRERPLPPKLRLIEQVQPHIRLYQCKYCGMKHLVDISGHQALYDEKQTPQMKNPALIGGEKGDSIWH